MAASVEAGMKLSPEWSAFGKVWAQPTEGRYGGDVGARFKNNLDLFAGGWGDTSGNYGAQAGVKWRF